MTNKEPISLDDFDLDEVENEASYVGCGEAGTEYPDSYVMINIKHFDQMIAIIKEFPCKECLGSGIGKIVTTPSLPNGTSVACKRCNGSRREYARGK